MAATYSLLSLCLFKHRSKSPGGRHDVTRKFWARVIPGYMLEGLPMILLTPCLDERSIAFVLGILGFISFLSHHS